jgi:hypothetical protein
VIVGTTASNFFAKWDRTGTVLLLLIVLASIIGYLWFRQMWLLYVSTIMLILTIVLHALPSSIRPTVKLALSAWAVLWGLGLAAAINGAFMLGNWIGRLVPNVPVTIPYGSEIAALTVASILLLVLAFAPILAIIVGVRLFHEKWLWGVYLTQLSFSLAILIGSASTPQGALYVALYAGLWTFFIGLVSFFLSTRLVGFVSKDYTFLRFALACPLSNVLLMLRRGDLFAHSYRVPQIQGENPLMASLKLLGPDWYVARIYGRQLEDRSELSVIAFHPVTYLGRICRNTRTDAICRDLLAIISLESNSRPMDILGPGPHPTTLDANVRDFALRETIGQWPNLVARLAGVLISRRRTLIKLAMVLAAITLIYVGVVAPQHTLVNETGWALLIVTSLIQLWEFYSRSR